MMSPRENGVGEEKFVGGEVKEIFFGILRCLLYSKGRGLDWG